MTTKARTGLTEEPIKEAQIEIIAVTEAPADVRKLKVIADKLRAINLSVNGYAIKTKRVIVKTSSASVFVRGKRVVAKKDKKVKESIVK